MNNAPIRVQNYVPANESRSVRMNVIKERKKTLEQNVEQASVRQETAHVETERGCEHLTDTETMGVIAAEAFNTLNRNRKDVGDALSVQQVPLQPVRSLPSDILYEIFAHCQSKPEEYDHLGNMKSSIHLSSVCRAWRLAACSLRRLWSDIFLNPFDTDGLHIIATFLERTDVRLNLAVDYHFWSHIHDASLDFLKDKFPFSHVQCLVIDATPDSGCNRLVEWSPEMPNITQLMIFTFEARVSVQGDVLRSFPNLQSLELDEVNLHFAYTFALPKLTRVKWTILGESLTPSSLVDLIQCTPNLESFSLFGPWPSYRDLSFTQVAFPPLDSLIQFEIDFHISIYYLVQYNIHFPSLQHLIFWIYEPAPIDEGFFVQHTGITALTRLTIKIQLSLDDKKLEESFASFSVLRHLRHIAHLVVEVPYGFDDEDKEYPQRYTVRLFDLLSICDPGPMFPKLQTISFAGDIHPPIASLVQLANARRGASLLSPETISRIQSFIFDCLEPLTVDERWCLDAAMGY